MAKKQRPAPRWARTRAKEEKTIVVHVHVSPPAEQRVTCTLCNGAGQVNGTKGRTPCHVCNGAGQVDATT